ncbi:MAG: hypothetical protein DCC75_08970 [Proteobacteria bacterium]|nr:MAG: hypothetical protein DCC75_08970 [Pseudomonadota bacterium]
MLFLSVKERYEIVRELGQGGGSVVYQVRDRERGGRQLALKVFLPGIIRSNDAHVRLRREAEILNKISHPNIVQAYDFFEEEGFIAYSREYVEGGDLRWLMQSSVLSHSQTLGILKQVASGLCALHSAEYIHLDIKPENILVDSNHGVKIADLGMAVRAIDVRPIPNEGTARYQAPELQYEAPHYGCDVYSIGVMGLEVAGPACRPDLRAILERAASREGVKRHQSAAELLNEFNACSKEEDFLGNLLRPLRHLLRLS